MEWELCMKEVQKEMEITVKQAEVFLMATETTPVAVYDLVCHKTGLKILGVMLNMYRNQAKLSGAQTNFTNGCEVLLYLANKV